MAIEERTRPYEIFIRINADKTFGASYRTIYELVRDGVVIVANEGSPVPLAVAADDPGAPFEEVMGEFANSALLANQNYQLQVTELTDSLAGSRAQVTQLTEEASKAQANIEQLTAAQDQLKQELASAQARIIELQNQLGSARGSANAETSSPELSDSQEVGEEEQVDDLPPLDETEESAEPAAEQETPQK